MLLGNENRHKTIQEDCYYDIIGDVHGFANELEELLEKLGYTRKQGIWRHETRKAIYVGDFIDRGPDSRRVLKIINAMVEFGSAHAILGNHEFNLIMYITKDSNGRPIRKPSESSRKLIDKVKDEFKDDPDLLKKYVKWLRTLPVYLSFDKFRVVHAYWNDEYIDLIDQHRTEGRFKKKDLKLMADPNHPLCNAINRITKGIEFRLPEDLIIKDSNNIRRNNFRIRWWESPVGKTFHELSFGNKFKLPDYTVPHQILFPFDIYNDHEPPVFFGHYCMGNGQMVPKKNICCIDACVANKGSLAAYRYNGESSINPDNFVFVQQTISFF